MSVSHWTTPLNLDMPALTVTMPAVTSIVAHSTLTCAAAVTVTPEGSSLMELPFESSMMTLPGPSLSVSLWPPGVSQTNRSEEHTSELQSRQYLVCRLLLEKKKISIIHSS